MTEEVEPAPSTSGPYVERVMAVADAMAADGVRGLIMPTMTDALCKVAMTHCDPDDIALRLEATADTFLTLAAAIRKRLGKQRLEHDDN